MIVGTRLAAREGPARQRKNSTTPTKNGTSPYTIIRETPTRSEKRPAIRLPVR